MQHRAERESRRLPQGPRRLGRIDGSCRLRRGLDEREPVRTFASEPGGLGTRGANGHPGRASVRSPVELSPYAHIGRLWIFGDVRSRMVGRLVDIVQPVVGTGKIR